MSERGDGELRRRIGESGTENPSVHREEWVARTGLAFFIYGLLPSSSFESSI